MVARARSNQRVQVHDGTVLPKERVQIVEVGVSRKLPRPDLAN